LTAPTSSRPMISQDKLSELQGTKDSSVKKNKPLDSSIKTNEDPGEIYCLSFYSHKFFFLHFPQPNNVFADQQGKWSYLLSHWP